MRRTIHPSLLSTLCAFALIFGLVFTPGQLLMAQNATQKIELLSSALRAHEAGDLEVARQNLEALLQMAPDDPNVRKLLNAVNEDLARMGMETIPVPGVPVAMRSDVIVDDEGTVTMVEEEVIESDAGLDSSESFEMVSDQAEMGDAQQLIDEVSSAQRRKLDSASEVLKQAASLAGQGDYNQAIELLDAAQDEGFLYEANKDAMRAIQKAKMEYALEKVELNYREADRNQAEAFLDEYRKMFGETAEYHALKKEVNEVVGNPYYRNPQEVSPEWVREQEEISQLLVKARSQFLFGDYQGAQQTLKDVEVRDPDNIEAKALQTRVAHLLDEGGQHDYKKTRAQMLEEVNRSWQRPQVFEVKQQDVPQNSYDSEALKKLKSVFIPKVSFSGMPLSRVIDTLSELSVQYDDTTADPSKKGINMVLIDPANLNPAVTITLRNFSLEKILEFVTKSVNFQYDVKSEAVVVQQGDNVTGLETRFFPVSRATVIRLTGVREEAQSEEASPFASASPFGGGGGLENRTQTEEKELKGFLERAGVNFSGTPGADLAFDGTQLIVTQSSRNLERLAVILRRYDETKQVEIEAKFMEVEQGALEELGFQWNLYEKSRSDRYFRTSQSGADSFNNFRNLSDLAVSSTTTDGKIQYTTIAGNLTVTTDDAESLPLDELFNSNELAISNTPPDVPGLVNFATGAGSAIGWGRTILGSWQADLTIRALEQNTGSDVMTAPRITVLAGKPASIVVAQEFRYPTEYGDVEAEVSASDFGGAAIGITPGTPQNFEIENIGVRLDVTPNVEKDNSITLKLNPRVSEFEGFVEYGGSAVALVSSSSGTNTAQIPSGFFMPVFSVREVQTEVTIFDGATVVLGGLTRDEIITVDDSVPVLGDIPLLGRLFRSKGETRQKRNLLIFVSANLISPGGSPSKQGMNTVRKNSLFQNPVIVTPGGAVSRTVKDSVGVE